MSWNLCVHLSLCVVGSLLAIAAIKATANPRHLVLHWIVYPLIARVWASRVDPDDQAGQARTIAGVIFPFVLVAVTELANLGTWKSEPTLESILWAATFGAVGGTTLWIQCKLGAFGNLVGELRSEIQQLQLAVASTRRELDFVRGLSALFTKVVADKSNKLTKLLRGGRTADPKKLADDLLGRVDPSDRIDELMLAVIEVFDVWLEAAEAGGGKKHSLRIAYFRLEGGYLRIQKSFNRGYTPGCVMGDQRPEQRERFKVPDGQSMAVNVALEGNPRIAPYADAEDQNQCHPFKHFREAQGQVIKSAACFPVGQPVGGFREHVVCLDTDRPGFFADAELPKILFVAENLAQRMQFELTMGRVLAAYRPPPKPKPAPNSKP